MDAAAPTPPGCAGGRQRRVRATRSRSGWTCSLIRAQFVKMGLTTSRRRPGGPTKCTGHCSSMALGFFSMSFSLLRKFDGCDLNAREEQAAAAATATTTAPTLTGTPFFVRLGRDCLFGSNTRRKRCFSTHIFRNFDRKSFARVTGNQILTEIIIDIMGFALGFLRWEWC